MRRDSNTSRRQSNVLEMMMSEEKIEVKKSITLMNGVGIIVGCIIGSGIFVSPLGVYNHSGSVGSALLVWTLSGLFSTVGALCYAELGTCITKSGGDYAYILEAFGGLAGFMRLWVGLIIIRPTSQAIIALTFAKYVVQAAVPPGQTIPDESVRLLAACCLLLLTYVNCASISMAMMIQNVFTAAKILALVIIIIAGVVSMFMNGTELLENPFEGEFSIGEVSLAFYAGLFAYGGWNYLNFVTDELKDPYKNLPRAIWIAVPLVTLVYVLTNIAYFAVVTPQELLSNPAVAETFGKKLFGSFSWCIPLFVALSTFGSVNGVLFTSGRLFFVGAEEGHLPALFSYIHPLSKAPIPSLIFTCATSLLMLSSTNIGKLMNYFSFVLWFSVAACIGALFYLRYSRPRMPRPIKVNLILPIIFFCCCLFLVAIPAYYEPFDTGMGALITLSGIPVYYIWVTIRDSPRLYTVSKKLTSLCQILLLVMHQEEHDDSEDLMK